MKNYQNNDRHGSQLLRRCAAPMLLLLAALVAGCGGGGEDRSNGSLTAVPIKLNAPADITNESAASYDSNVTGLITGATLKRWKDDWLNQRPAHIKGKLVILQVTTGETVSTGTPPAVTGQYSYFQSNGINVFAYLAASAEWVMTRSNGVISTPSLVLDGPSMDAMLKKYDIDPLNDMIVLAQGTAGQANVMSQGRAWLALHYWGVDAKNLAVLNGGNKWQFDSGAMTAADFVATPLTPLNDGRFSVKNIPVDNTSMIASVGEFLAVVPATDVSMKGSGVFIWDARTITQYSAGQMRELNDGAAAGCGTAPYCAASPTFDYMGSFQNNGSRQGHPNGALDLNFANLLDATKGFSFKPKAQLISYMNGEKDATGYGMLDGSYKLVGAGNAYQPGDMVYVYCETTFRAMITGMASSVILGRPTRFYDGAMIEWNSLSNLPQATGDNILPPASPWRTDVKSFFRPANSAAKVALRKIIDPYAPNADAITAEDRAYKTPSAGKTSRDGGGAAPANPCGG
jgi:3-mercaptopyruvate sulfurtransferase SseA